MGHTDLLDRLEGIVDEFVAAGPSCFSDPESLRRLHCQTERLGAFEISAIGEFDLWDGGAADGAKSSAAWVSCQFNEPVQKSRRRVKHGRLLKDLPVVAEAF